MYALVVVDIQNDFLNGGTLTIEGGNDIIPTINRLIEHFDLVIGVRDWHPENHVSFAKTHKKPVGTVVNVNGVDQILWPPHCVQDSRGAEFPDSLIKDKFQKIFNKGTDLAIDSYGAFFDNARNRSTGLYDYLREKGVTHIVLAGLSTEYCVKATALDGMRLGFQVTVVTDGIKAINLHANDGEKALAELKAAGVSLMKSDDLL